MRTRTAYILALAAFAGPVLDATTTYVGLSLYPSIREGDPLYIFLMAEWGLFLGAAATILFFSAIAIFSSAFVLALRRAGLDWNLSAFAGFLPVGAYAAGSWAAVVNNVLIMAQVGGWV
jgi:hypothetical protein